MAAQVILVHFVQVRVLMGQPFRENRKNFFSRGNASFPNEHDRAQPARAAFRRSRVAFRRNRRARAGCGMRGIRCRGFGENRPKTRGNRLREPGNASAPRSRAGRFRFPRESRRLAAAEPHRGNAGLIRRRRADAADFRRGKRRAVFFPSLQARVRDGGKNFRAGGASARFRFRKDAGNH